MNKFTSKLFVDHIVLTVSNITKSKKFYSKIFGTPDGSDKCSCWFKIDKTKIFLATPYGKMPKKDRFNPNRIGLEHWAIGVSNLSKLRQIEDNLTTKKIKHSGIHIDKHSKLEKIWLDDPDGMRIEFFLRK